MRNFATLAITAIFSLWGAPALMADSAPIASFNFDRLEEVNTHWSDPKQPLPKQVPGPSKAYGKAVDFSQTEGCYTIPFNADQYQLGDLDSTKGITIAFWVKHKFEQRDQNHRIITGPGIDVTMMKGPYHLNVYTGNAVSCHVKLGPKKVDVLDGKWHHVVISTAFEPSDENCKIYVDGEFLRSLRGTFLQSFTASAKRGAFIIGARNKNGKMGFRGALDEVNIYDRAIGSHEVAHLAAGGVSAGIDQEIWLPEPAIVHGFSKQAASWSIKGAGRTKIADKNAAKTKIHFSEAGTYSATYTNRQGQSKSVKIKVNPPTAPTIVLRGPEGRTLKTNQNYLLEASVTSPYSNEQIKVEWKQISGPSSASIVPDKTTLQARLKFSQAGLYEFQASSKIDKLEGSDFVQLSVKQPLAPQHYTDLYNPIYSIGFESPPTRSPLLTEDLSENTGYLYKIKKGSLPKLTKGARDFTGHALDLSGSTAVPAIYNRNTNSLFGHVRLAKGFGVSFWVKGERPHNNANILNFGNFRVFPDGREEHAKGLNINIGRNGKFTARPPGSLFDGKWHHCVITGSFDPSNSWVKVYLDGVLTTESTYNIDDLYIDSFNSSEPAHWHYLGGRKEDFQTFNGSLDDITAFTRPLDEATIKGLFEGPDAEVLEGLTKAAVEVNTGINQQIAMPATKTTLKGSVRHAREGTRYQWSLLSGDGTATFSEPNSLTTEVTFDHQLPSINPDYGSYRIRLEAKSPEGLISHDEMTVSCYTPSDKKVRPSSPLPAAGVHPRILFSPSDIPFIRENCKTDPLAIASLARIKKDSQRKLDAPQTPQGITYQKFKAGERFDPTPGLVSYDSDVARNISGEAGSLYNVMYARAFVAFIENDLPKQKEIAEVASHIAAEHSKVYKPNYENKLTHDVASPLAMTYDILAPIMSEKQRKPIRELLSKMTKFRQTYGSAHEAIEACGNWNTFHDHILIAALAIEGEEGYDPRLLEQNTIKLRNFFTRYGMYPSGCAHEGWGYFNFGLGNATFSTLATARRDENFFKTTALSRTLDMAFRNLVTWEGGVRGNHDIPAGIVSQIMPFTIVAARVYDDPIVSFLQKTLQDGIVEKKKDQRNLTLLTALFAQSFPEEMDYKKTADQLSLDVFCKDTGYMTTRSSWEEDGLHFVFRCRMDKYFVGHVHPDVNAFELWSHQRHWFMDLGKFEIENDFHSTVLIDGIGGGGSLNWWTWPSLPGRFLHYEQSDDHVLGVGDAEAFYDYARYASKSPTGYVTPAIKNKLGLTNASVLNHGLTWKDFTYPSTDPKQLPEWRNKSISFDFAYRSGDKPLFVFNPVEKALRSAALYRKGAPFIIIQDDIKKDEQKYTYSWLANMLPEAIEVIKSSPDTLLLKHKKDPLETGPRLLVKVLGVQGKSSIRLEEHTVKASQLKVTRVQIDAKGTTNPRFEVLLYPHLPGEPLPKVTTTKAEHQVTIGKDTTTVTRGIKP